MKATILLGLLAVALAGSLDECNSMSQSWVDSFHQAEAMKCFNSSLPSSEIHDSINCGSMDCISRLNSLTSISFMMMCSEDYPEFVTPNEYSYVDALKTGLNTMCNRCVVGYQALQVEASQEKYAVCLAVDSMDEVVCSTTCVDYRQAYYDEANRLVSDVCMMYSPGGCGDTGGLTEGEIYDILAGSQMERAKMLTANQLCFDTCPPVLEDFYQGLMDLADTCVSTNTAMTMDGLLLGDLDDYEFVANCELMGCDEKLNNLKQQGSSISAQCQKGITNHNLMVFSKAISLCEQETKEEEASIWDMMPEPSAMLLSLSAIGLICIVLYMLVGTLINRLYHGKRGWDQIPHSRYLCCCFVPRSQSRQVSEMVQLHDDDDDFSDDDKV